MDGQGTKWRRNTAEDFNRLSRVHERYRLQTTDRQQTDGRQHIANVNVNANRSLKTVSPMLSDRCISSVLSVCDVGVLWPNGWMDQDATWYGGGPDPGHIVLDWDLAPPKRGTPPVIIIIIII